MPLFNNLLVNVLGYLLFAEYLARRFARNSEQTMEKKFPTSVSLQYSDNRVQGKSGGS